jgi:hypothetical protein
MPYILGSIPYFRCLVRKEYVRDLKDGHHGAYVDAIAHGIRCIRGQSLQFQVNLLDPLGGAACMLPIDALVWKECPRPDDTTYTGPWDVQASEFGVCELDFVKRGAVEVLPGRIAGQYRFTVSFAGSDLAEDAAQMKSLHVCFLENGLIGAFPNNRILWSDPAFWDVMAERPDFESLHYEARAEGNQHLFRRGPVIDGGPSGGDMRNATPLNGVHSNPKDRPDWMLPS